MPHLLMLLLLFACAAWPVELRNDFDAGRRCYLAGDFKKAVSHFKRAVVSNPTDADAHFWLGKSYENLADIGGPVLGLRASSNARAHLAKAFQLAPANQEYRREYFDFLVASGHLPGALRVAGNIIQTTPRWDPDYPFMSTQLENERRARTSAEGRIGATFGLLQQALAPTIPASGPALQAENSITLLAQARR